MDNSRLLHSVVKILQNQNHKDINPMLDCKYMINFNRLPLFLSGLIDNDFVFSKDLLPVHVG
jgi:hypothetical protein